MLSLFRSGTNVPATLTLEQENCVASLAEKECELKNPSDLLLYNSLAKGMLDALSLEDAVSLTGLILRKRFEQTHDVGRVFQKSFAFYLTRDLLQRLQYPVGQNGPKLLALLFNMTCDHGFSSNRRRSDLTGNRFGPEIIKELNEKIPPLVLSLLTPLYHAILNHAGNNTTPMGEFLQVFTKLFLFDPLVNIPMDKMDDDSKMALGQNASWLKLFPVLLNALEAASKTFTPKKPTDVALMVAATYQKFFSLQSNLEKLCCYLNQILQKFSDHENGWPRVYKDILDFFRPILASLPTEGLDKTDLEISSLNASIESNMEGLLSKIMQPLPKDMACIDHIMQAMVPLLKRINDLRAIFTTIAKESVPDSPAHQFYAKGVESLNEHLEKTISTLVYNIANLSAEEVALHVKNFNTELHKLVEPFRTDTLDGETALHRLVKITFSGAPENNAQTALLRLKLQEQIERLLLEGFDPKAKTTSYQRSVWNTLRRRQDPLDASGLAALYNNGDIYVAALQLAEEKKSRADLDALWAFHPDNSLNEPKESSTPRTASAAFAALDAAVSASSSGEALFARAEKAAQAAEEATRANMDAAAAKLAAQDTPMTDAEKPVAERPIAGGHREAQGIKRQMRAPGSTPTETPSATPSTTPAGTPRASREVIVERETKRGAAESPSSAAAAAAAATSPGGEESFMIEPIPPVIVKRVVRVPVRAASEAQITPRVPVPPKGPNPRKRNTDVF